MINLKECAFEEIAFSVVVTATTNMAVVIFDAALLGRGSSSK
jgi:hypothetical protein